MISPEILRRYPYFSAATDEGLRELAMLSDEEFIPANTVVCAEGDRADKLYILVEGEMDVQYTLGSGELRTVDTIVPGELVMWSALVEPYKSTAVVTTRQDSKVIAMDAAKLRQFCQDHCDVASDVLMHLTKLLANRLEGARVQLATID
ncbi:MAG: cyclic nucleotide-binding domain-containing protein [Planctomycetota bacterium]